MNILLTHIAKAIRIGALLAVLLVIAGCSEIKPYNPPNHREEGPSKGLFTGSQGEWVIVGPKAPQAGGEEDKNAAAESEADGEKKKNSEDASDGAQ